MAGKNEHTWLEGTVKPGDGRGRDIGFPTANIVLDKPELRPVNGIYACWAKINKNHKLYQAALHVGPVPTFNKERVTVELHLLDFLDKDLYEERISFTCIKHLRNIIKFDTVKELKLALNQDCIATKEVLNNNPIIKS